VEETLGALKICRLIQNEVEKEGTLKFDELAKWREMKKEGRKVDLPWGEKPSSSNKFIKALAN
jgi:hypothetical protein